MDSRLRVGHAIGKTEEEIALELMKQVKMHAPDEGPPAVSSDGKGAYPKAMLETWGKVESVRIKVVYGNTEDVKAKLGCHTAYIERTNLTSRTMNGRLVRKTLSFSKELRFLEASSILEDAIYNFTRPVKTLRVELPNPSKQARWQQRSPAMAASLTDHIWTVRELLTVVLVPLRANT